MARKSTAVAKRASKQELAKAREELAQEAATIQDQIGAPATNAISIKDKVFTLPNGTVMQAPIEVVILNFNSQNKYYEGAWDAKNPSPPVCWAISNSAKNLIPSDNATDKQAKDCSECPLNEFGSNGDGKACKNNRVIAVMLPEDGADGQIYTMSVPPTAIKAFDGYVASVAKLYNVPPIGVITTVDFNREQSYPLPLFGNPEANPDLDLHLARRPEADTLLTAEPDTSSATTEAPKKKARARKK